MKHIHVVKTGLLLTALLMAVNMGSLVLGIMLNQPYVIALASCCAALVWGPGLLGADFPLLWKISSEDLNISMIIVASLWIPLLLLLAPEAIGIGIIQVAALWIGYRKAWKKNVSYRATFTEVPCAEFISRRRPF